MNRSLKTFVTLSCSSLLVGNQLIWPQSPADAQVFVNFIGCPTGTREGPVNFVQNGNFATVPGVTGTLPAGNPAQFTSTLPYRGDFLYPDDNGTSPGSLNALGGISIQRGSVNYLGGIVIGQPFPGDPRFGVDPSDTYLYSNPNAAAATPLAPESAFPDPIIWDQVISGLSPNSVYNFTAYFYNLLSPTAPGAAPVIRLLAGPVGGPPGAFVPNIAGQPVATRQNWLAGRVEALFRPSPGQTSLQLRILDQANTVIGDDFGVTAIGFRECIPTLAITKAAGTPQQNADGTFTIPYTINVTNNAPANSATLDFGPAFIVNNLQLTENLSTVFTNATLQSVTSVQSPTLTVNPAFNGTSDTNLLASGVNTLAPATTATVSFNAIVTPGTGANGQGPFTNQVTASGSSQSNLPLTTPPAEVRVRLPGTGGPGGNPQFVLVKRITGVTRNGGSLPGVNFGAFTNDPNSTSDDDPAWAQFPPVGVIDVSTSTPLQSGDLVTYTVYFLSNGQTEAIDTNICDLIPPGTTLVPNTNQIQLGNGGITPGGTVFTPLAPLPANNSCPDQNNPNGAVIFNLGNVANTPTNNIGFVRFQVRIN